MTLKTDMKKGKQLQQTCPIVTRPALRLSEVERLIRGHRIVVPPPSRPSLQKLCEEGTFETVGGGPTVFGWLVYEDSFWKWASEMAGDCRNRER